MTKLTECQEKNIKKLAEQGLSPLKISNELNLNAQCIYRRLKVWGLLSIRQQQIKEQNDLKKQNKRRCYQCGETHPMDTKFFGFSLGVWRRRCKKCDNTAAKANHHKRMLSLTLDDAIRYKLYQAKSRSKHKKYNFNLTHEHIKSQWTNQNGLCFYTGLQMTTLPNHYNYFSIDRYDSSKGYSPDNIVLCCHVINMMKKDMTEKEFIEYCEAVVMHKNR